MMKKIAWFFAMLWLCGCSASNHMALFTLSQAELNQQISQGLAQQLTPMTLAGVPMKVHAIRADAVIAPEGRSVIQVAMAADFSATIALLQLPVQVMMTVEAEPFFDQRQQAVYLHHFKLVSATAKGAGYKGQLKPLSAELQRWLETWFAKQAVYRLDANKMEHRLLLNMPLKIQLLPGQMQLSPAFNQ